VSSYSEIGYDAADRVLTITLNRSEKVNAFTEVLANEFGQHRQLGRPGRRHAGRGDGTGRIGQRACS
jgi:1,4-dihydroxy-2-naphthoyl-CoA synthase